ncbi:chromosome partitioning protein, ParB family [Pseudorhodobacter antarcticus]|uniref:Chromosome partitioning protein, ParB family n=1 Tax=Pseudorhodobacter antarcticus TaxID=1077947 RepID=A0A1H8NVS7_9RHOB|nr:chromosome partitioning protein, ParB family [Pseudorhodobacter antarcticus]
MVDTITHSITQAGRSDRTDTVKLVNDTFRSAGASGSCLEASVRQVYLSAQAPDLKDSPEAQAVDDRHASWEADLPLGDDVIL